MAGRNNEGDMLKGFTNIEDIPYDRSGFEVFMHPRVPTNDGGISLGQASMANARIKSGRTS